METVMVGIDISSAGSAAAAAAAVDRKAEQDTVLLQMITRLNINGSRQDIFGIFYYHRTHVWLFSGPFFVSPASAHCSSKVSPTGPIARCTVQSSRITTGRGASFAALGTLAAAFALGTLAAAVALALLNVLCLLHWACSCCLAAALARAQVLLLPSTDASAAAAAAAFLPR
jgi:hypothetical protein